MRFLLLLRTSAQGGKAALSRAQVWVPVQSRDRYPQKPGNFVGTLLIFGPVPTLGRKNYRCVASGRAWAPRWLPLALEFGLPTLHRGSRRAGLEGALPPDPLTSFHFVRYPRGSRPVDIALRAPSGSAPGGLRTASRGGDLPWHRHRLATVMSILLSINKILD